MGSDAIELMSYFVIALTLFVHGYSVTSKFEEKKKKLSGSSKSSTRNIRGTNYCPSDFSDAEWRFTSSNMQKQSHFLSLLSTKFQEALTHSLITQFNGNTSLVGYTCPVNNTVFKLEKSMSNIHCARVCHSYATCREVFYQPETLACVGCSTVNETTEYLSTPTKSVYFERGARTCSKNSCYSFVPDKLTWDEAKNNCELLGGVLVDILSQEEQEILNHSPLLNRNVNEGIWIGGTDSENEGVFVWPDGTPIGYSNWYPREPNNSNGREHCIGMWSSHSNKWNDYRCGVRCSSICEFK